MVAVPHPHQEEQSFEKGKKQGEICGFCSTFHLQTKKAFLQKIGSLFFPTYLQTRPGRWVHPVCLQCSSPPHNFVFANCDKLFANYDSACSGVRGQLLV